MVMRQQIDEWFQNKGDQTHRLDYELDSNSIVMDVGAYLGEWSDSILKKYNCKILAFEPVKDLFNYIDAKFVHLKDQVRCFEFGLAAKSGNVRMEEKQDASSVQGYDANGSASVMDIDEFLRSEKLEKIDLIKINIEGFEYDLVDRILDSGNITKFVNLQIQFHNFVPNAETRLLAIRERLSKTHTQTYCYDFVWENWKLNS